LTTSRLARAGILLQRWNPRQLDGGAQDPLAQSGDGFNA
jgi:hypothetical protein